MPRRLPTLPPRPRCKASPPLVGTWSDDHCDQQRSQDGPQRRHHEPNTSVAFDDLPHDVLLRRKPHHDGMVWTVASRRVVHGAVCWLGGDGHVHDGVARPGQHDDRNRRDPSWALPPQHVVLRFEFRDVEHLRAQYGEQQRHSLLSRELKAPEIRAAHPDRAVLAFDLVGTSPAQGRSGQSIRIRVRKARWFTPSTPIYQPYSGLTEIQRVSRPNQCCSATRAASCLDRNGAAGEEGHYRLKSRT